MKNITPYFLATALALAGCTPEQENDEKPETYNPLVEPNMVLHFSDFKDQPRSIDVFVISQDELRQYIRDKLNLKKEVEINYKDHSKLVWTYIDQKLSKFNYSYFSDLRVKSEIYETLIAKNAVHQPMAFPLRGKKAAIIIDADTSYDAKDWIASWLKLDRAEIKDEHGIDDQIMEDFIRYHEIAHAMFADERHADGFAALSIVHQYGVTKNVLATLNFLADTRLVRPTHPKYWGNAEAISINFGLAPWHWIAGIEYSVYRHPYIIGDHDSLKSYSPLRAIGRENYWGSEHNKYIKKIFENLPDNLDFHGYVSALQLSAKNVKNSLTPVTIVYDFNSDGIDRRGLPTCVKGPCSEKEFYEEFDLASKRLETLLKSSSDISFYSSIKPQDFHLEGWIEGPSKFFPEFLQSGVKPRHP